MGYEELKAAGTNEIINGEHLLLGGTPPEWSGESVSPAFFYKRRYTWDGDIVMGCTIGCKFCYYRWINNSVDTIGKGKKGLRRIGTPEDAVEFLEKSKLFAPDRDIVMLCARSDGSMQISELTQFLRVFPHKNPVFILHRGYFGKKQLEEWGQDKRAIYCTTITPAGPNLLWTPIKTEKQIEGLKLLLKNGIPASRISVMFGPLNSNNIQNGVKLIQQLAGLGIEFLTYRGCSIGNFGVAPKDDQLRKIGFLDGGQNENSAPSGHSYYKMKNWLAPEVEKTILKVCQNCGIRTYRFTGSLYRDEFGMPVAYNRNNRWRRELGQWTKVEISKLDDYLCWLGYHPFNIREIEDGYYIELPKNEVATEDVAMTVGAEFKTSVIFNNHRIAPTLADLRFYDKNSLFQLPKGWKSVINI